LEHLGQQRGLRAPCCSNGEVWDEDGFGKLLPLYPIGAAAIAFDPERAPGIGRRSPIWRPSARKCRNASKRPAG
jgi:hypothetical protein